MGQTPSLNVFPMAVATSQAKNDIPIIEQPQESAIFLAPWKACHQLPDQLQEANGFKEVMQIRDKD